MRHLRKVVLKMVYMVICVASMGLPPSIVASEVGKNIFSAMSLRGEIQ